jgi:hypothetical protein
MHVYLIKESTQTFNRNDVNIQIGAMRKIVKEKINAYMFLTSSRET